MRLPWEMSDINEAQSVTQIQESCSVDFCIDCLQVSGLIKTYQLDLNHVSTCCLSASWNHKEMSGLYRVLSKLRFCRIQCNMQLSDLNRRIQLDMSDWLLWCKGMPSSAHLFISHLDFPLLSRPHFPLLLVQKGLISSGDIFLFPTSIV